MANTSSLLMSASIATMAIVSTVVGASCSGGGLLDVYVGEPENEPEPDVEPEPVPDSGNAATDDGGINDDSVFEGDLVVAASGTAALEQYDRVTGDVVISGIPDESFVIDRLDHIDGHLRIVANPSLRSLVFRDLTTVGGDVIVTGNQLLATASFPVLVSLARDVVVSENAALTFLGFDAVSDIGGSLRLSSGRNLRFHALDAIDGDLDVDGTVAGDTFDVVTIEFPVLRTVVRDVSVRSAAKLATLLLPELESVGGSLRVRDNPLLSAIDLGAVTAVGLSVCVCQNPNLSQCTAAAFAAQLSAAGHTGAVDTAGNAAVEPCP